MEENVFDKPAPDTNTNTFEDAKKFLNLCHRLELRDHAFGDREITWTLLDVEVAGGYFGGGSREVWIDQEHGGGSWTGQEASELVVCGKIDRVERNDETGPDFYEGA